MNLKLHEVLDPELIVDLNANTLEEAVRELIERLAVAGRIPTGEVDSIVRDVCRRESLGSSGIGNGFAMPNLRRRDVEDLLVVVGGSRTPIDWQAIDARPVHVVFCLIGPMDQPGTRLRALEVLVRFVDSTSMDRLLAGDDFKETLLAAVTEYDEPSGISRTT